MYFAYFTSNLNKGHYNLPEYKFHLSVSKIKIYLLILENII